MRKSKKLLAFALAAAMVMGISAPAFADDPAAPAVVSDEGRIDTVSVNGTDQTGSLAAATGKITITNTKVGETYSIYRIFELASFKDEICQDKYERKTLETPKDSHINYMCEFVCLC